MKSKFLALFSREFSGRLWQVWVFPLAAALFQPLLYWLAVREMYESARFEELYASSAAPILLAVLLVLGIAGILLAALYVAATSAVDSWQAGLLAGCAAATQGILTAGCSVYVNQLIKQQEKEE